VRRRGALFVCSRNTRTNTRTYPHDRFELLLIVSGLRKSYPHDPSKAKKSTIERSSEYENSIDTVATVRC
jgi:hypothetical protein